MSKSLPAAEVCDAHDVAARWVLKVEAGRMSAAETDRLEAWLAQDPSHQAAWEKVNLAMAAADKHVAAEEVMALRAYALAAKPEPRPMPWWLVAASIAAVVIGGGSFLGIASRGTIVVTPAAPGAPSTPSVMAYRTGIGERLTVPLPDGSSVTLDTNSRIQLAYTDKERGVKLLLGQAMFDVAKHQPRAFRVYAGDRTVTAVGTKFNVRLDGAGKAATVKVALLEGSVKVRAVDAPRFAFGSSGEVMMTAGEVLQAQADAPVKVVTADVEKEAGWRSGVVVFAGEPLSAAIQEMNRYTDRPIRLADARFGSSRISGAYRTGDPERFAATVAEFLPLEVHHSEDGAPVLAPRE